MATKTIGYTQWNGKLFYVSDLRSYNVKGHDWGYNTDASKAIHLLPYWAKRFNADCRYCGRSAQFLTVEV